VPDWHQPVDERRRPAWGPALLASTIRAPRNAYPNYSCLFRRIPADPLESRLNPTVDYPDPRPVYSRIYAFTSPSIVCRTAA